MQRELTYKILWKKWIRKKEWMNEISKKREREWEFCFCLIDRRLSFFLLVLPYLSCNVRFQYLNILPFWQPLSQLNPIIFTFFFPLLYLYNYTHVSWTTLQFYVCLFNRLNYHTRPKINLYYTTKNKKKQCIVIASIKPHTSSNHQVNTT